MKIIIDCKNKNLPKCQFEAIKKMFDGLFREFSFEFINYKIVDDVIEDYANTQFFIMAMAENQQEQNDTSKVTRVEVIQHSPPYNGRAYTNYNAKDVEIQYQDDGKTLKIFLK